ncbi:neutral zinc metallopeptidase [uncultured Anaerococcus sp.]|uniref:KPN_02809 family neutral zinc metallopeptidase n=1 Tax=uncultured Anaerococcus sp. TaxID=293428 RepID=UPI00262F481F|nr:neutral zinc metallopeptidase [uncultured Anaerococcus sp.]
MKWENRRRSSNVRKGQSYNSGSRSGGRGGIPIRVGGLKGVILLLVLLFFGRILGGLSGGDSTYNDNSTNQYNNPQTQQSQTTSQDTNRDKLEDFLSVILADTEDVWHDKFEEIGAEYEEPIMVPFSGTTRSACGVASKDMGPFYCPLDESIYIDVDFYNQLQNQFGAGGDFAFAYVLAHEVGHHVQNQLGILDQTNKLRRTLSTKEYNKYSVAQELQADYFGGLFAYYVEEKGYLDPGDIDEAMDAAAAIGDDKIQEMSGREVNVDTFTHGSSEQRKEAFDLGYKYHDIDHSMIFFDRLK